MGNARFVAELLKMNPDINAMSNDRESALHRAVIYGHVDIILLLLKAGADMLAPDKLGNFTIK